MPTQRQISSWSFHRLLDFEKCPRLAELKYLERIPEPPRPLPPGKTEHANDRGSRVHLAAENYVRGTGDFTNEMSAFREEFECLHELYAEGKVSLEEDWAHDRNWGIAPWKAPETWLRLKLDVVAQPEPGVAVVIDHKTGKRFGNETKHGEQVQLYALCTFLRYPALHTVHTELWYLDQDDLMRLKFTREQAMRFYRNFNDRGTAMTSATEFPPRPGLSACKYCPYGPRGTGHCKVGVQL